MGDVSYRPLIEDMTWSYSRIKCYQDCPYRWYLQYICELEGTPKFYASYGTFMHKLLEGFYKGELSRDEMVIKFLFGFHENVLGTRPQASTVKKYIDSGVEYLKNFTPVQYDTILDVEGQYDFTIRGIPFTGIIDLVCADKNGIFPVDHKSRALKPRSKRKKPTLSDEELDEMLRQMYLYAAAIEQKYGELPYKLCFNCFRTGEFIEEPFNKAAYEAALDWAASSIETILEHADSFPPIPEYFACWNICDVSNECCYFEMQFEK